MKQILLGYRRKSMVRNQADLVSPERQARSCELWLEMHGDEYSIEWYEDVEGHRSGRWEKTRPGWRDLLTQLDRPDVAGVIADTLDRVYRNVKEFGEFLDRLKAARKKLILVKQSIDTDTAIGQAITMFMMVVYQLESDQTAERMTRNIEYKRKELGRHWGPTPFGCDRDAAGQLVPSARIYLINPATGEAILRNGTDPDGYEPRRYYDSLFAAATLYAEGVHSYDDVAASLNAAGWRYGAAAKGHAPRLYTRDDIRRIASFWQLYRGELPLGNITNAKNPVIVAGGHGPILPVDLCDKLGAIKSQRAGSTWSRAGEEKRLYLLSDIAHCVVCGRKLKGYFQNGRQLYRHYGAKQGCTERWSDAATLEGQVLARLTTLAQSELLAEIAAEARRLARELFAQSDTTAPLLAELDRERERLTRLEDMYLDGDIDRDRYRQRKSDLTQKIAEIEDKLYTASHTVNFDQVYERIINTLNRLDSAKPETQKALINSLIERLDVGSSQVVHLQPRPWAKPFF